MRVAIVSRGGVVAARQMAPLPAGGEPTALASTLRDLLSNLERMGPLPQDFVGVAIPGIWDRATSIMRKAVNLPALEGVNIRTFFEETLQRSAVIEVDVNAACWAQWRQLSPAPNRFAYLSLGTGIGGAVILDGQLIRHTHGGAGHFGFLIVDTSAEATKSGHCAPGSLSAVASGPALQALSGLDTRSPIEARGTLSRQAIETAARGLAVGILQIVQIYMPDVLMLGGGVIDHQPELVEAVKAAFAKRRNLLTPEQFRIEKAPLCSDEAGAVGAALLAIARWAGN